MQYNSNQIQNSNINITKTWKIYQNCVSFNKNLKLHANKSSWMSSFRLKLKLLVILKQIVIPLSTTRILLDMFTVRIVKKKATPKNKSHQVSSNWKFFMSFGSYSNSTKQQHEKTQLGRLTLCSLELHWKIALPKATNLYQSCATFFCFRRLAESWTNWNSHVSLSNQLGTFKNPE